MYRFSTQYFWIIISALKVIDINCTRKYIDMQIEFKERVRKSKFKENVNK